MSPTAETLLQESLKLTEVDRAELAAQLLDSLHSEDENGDPELTEAEITRRIKELEDGTVQAIPWSQVREAILEIKNEPYS